VTQIFLTFLKKRLTAGLKFENICISGKGQIAKGLKGKQMLSTQ